MTPPKDIPLISSVSFKMNRFEYIMMMNLSCWLAREIDQQILATYMVKVNGNWVTIYLN